MLQKEFLGQRNTEGGLGLVVQGIRYSAWYDAAGIHFAEGDTVHVLGARLVSWEQAAARIDHLLHQGRFQSSKVLNEAIYQERLEIAAELWMLQRDVRGPFLQKELFEGGFPDSMERIADKLRDLSFVEEVRSALTDLLAAEQAGETPLRWRFHHPKELLERMEKLTHSPIQYPVTEFAPEPPEVFITQDELEWFIRSGPGVHDGKQRIQTFFLEDHRPKELADFLKSVYGTGGYSHGDFWVNFSGQGFSLSRSVRGKETEVKLTWSKLAREVKLLIDTGRYLSPEELEELAAQEEEKRISGESEVGTLSEEPEPEVLLSEELEPAPPSLEPQEEPPAETAKAEVTQSTDPKWVYPRKGGTFVYLDSSHLYQIERTTEYDVYLTDMQNPAVAGRVVQQSRFDEALALSPLNDHLKQNGQPTQRDSRTVYKECLYSSLALLRQDSLYGVLRSRDVEADQAEDYLTEYLDQLMELNQESAPEFVDVYLHWPRFREWMIEDVLQRSYQDVLVNGRDAVELYQEQPDSPDWVRGKPVSVPQQAIENRKEQEQAPTEPRIGTIQSEGAVSSPAPEPDLEDYIVLECLVGEYGLLSEPDKAEFESHAGKLSTEIISKRLAEHFDGTRGEIHAKASVFSTKTKSGVTQNGAKWYADRAGFHVTVDGLEPIDRTWQAVAATLRTLYTPQQHGLTQETIVTPEEPETAEPVFPFNLGDTVYLDGDPYVIESIGLFDVYLEDRTYNTNRVESKEDFLRLVERYPQQEQAPTQEEPRIGTIQSENAPEEPQSEPETQPPAAPETPPEQPYPFKVGDTVYLEDGTAFLIEQIGPYDVQLRDPTLLYPIFRAESKENLLRLVERYPQRQEYSVSSRTVHPAGDTQLPYDIVVERLHFEPELTPSQEPKPTVQAHEPTPEPTPKDHKPTPEPTESGHTPTLEPEPQPEPEDQPTNFRITDEHLGEGGQKEKFWRNIKVIAVLKQLEGEERQATIEEQHILSQYVGWGGLPDAFDPNKAPWTLEYSELKELLTDREYTAARASVLNAHFTSPTVIHAVYAALDRLGFQSGRILEPSCGVGNFFGLLPEKMAHSQLYGVELDSISGRIAAQLYPDANITVSGFETTNRPGFYDVAVGNVPFGQYEVNDPDYNLLHFSIHNYFFAKALDQVRPGGLVAFITSRFTMDSRSTNVRRYLAQRADLVGAIRLPNNAFLANAGTEVTSDILIFQRRSEPRTVTEENQWPEWVHTGELPNDRGETATVNQYFLNHPEMVMGHLELKSTHYGYDVTCAPLTGRSLEQQLSEVVERLPRGVFREAEQKVPEVVLPEAQEDELPADESVRNFSFTAIDGEVYYRENAVMLRQELSPRVKARMQGLISLGQMVRAVIQAQLDGCSDEALLSLQEQLNGQYDEFAERFGRVNSRENRSAFSNDSTYYLICSLEDYEQGKFVGKSDLFTKRTIRQTERVVHCNVPREALAVSLNERGRVDLPYMARLLDMSETEVTEALAGQIYVLPETLGQEQPAYVSESEYLSGNIRQKLEEAKQRVEEYPALRDNITALEKAMPERVTAAEIEVHLGATWIPVKYLNDFVQEVILSTDGYLPYQYRYYARNLLPVVELSTVGDSPVWNITNKTKDQFFRTNSQEVWGINYRGGKALEILEKTLNLREITITVKDDEGRSFTHPRATTEARAKQAALQQKFSEWIFEDPERREALEELYNQKFNSIKPRVFDGSYMTFPGMSPYLNLRPHQKAAVAHALYGGNTLFAHVVGAGKSAEMIATAMEGKRLGLHHKSLFVVPKHTIEQMAKEFVRFYPSANVLVARPADFTAANRKKFCARIAAGDYDAVIMSFSQFERIPISQERQERLLQEQIDEIVEAQSMMEERSFSLKQMVKMEKSLQARLEKLQATERKDDVITFEQLGVDKLFVDEAHYYKNSFVATKMTNVAGIGQSASQKCFDLDMKCRYLDEVTGGRGIVFATGTPVSNSMSELFVMQRYLMRSRLNEIGLGQFDSWAATFGQTETQMELAPEGSGYRMKTRFSRFYNVPELMQLFQLCSDIRLSSDLNLDVPEASYHTVVAEPTPEQKEMISDLSSRAEAVHNRLVDPEQDNMLKITSDGRKIGLDPRLMDPEAPDEAGSKVNLCVRNVLDIWKKTAENRLTQIIFSDFSTPNAHRFNVYYDIRDKLLAAGVPAEEIAFIHDYNTDKAKDTLFAKVRSGEVRVLLGSTQKLGVGTNVQTKLIAIHDLDAPWRPGDLEQRSGRIIRQGNRNPHVDIFRYVTNGSFDSFLFQILESKQRFIGQIMSAKTNVRDCKDTDETVLSFAEIKSLCAGDPRIKERMVLDVDVKRLKMLQSAHQSQIYRLQDDVRRKYPVEIRACKMMIDNYRQDIATLEAHPLVSQEEGKAPFAPMTVAGQVYHQRKEAGEAILELAKTVRANNPVQIGEWRGMKLKVALQERESLFNEPTHPVLLLEGRNSYQVDCSTDAYGTIARLCNRVAKLPMQLTGQESRLSQLNKEFESAKQRQFEPFPQEAELSAKVQRLVELTESLNLDRREGEQRSAEEDAPDLETNEERRPVRSSLSARLRQAEARSLHQRGSGVDAARHSREATR